MSDVNEPMVFLSRGQEMPEDVEGVNVEDVKAATEVHLAFTDLIADTLGPSVAFSALTSAYTSVASRALTEPELRACLEQIIANLPDLYLQQEKTDRARLEKLN